MAEHKPYQLALAAEIGFDVPRTLITNCPTEAVQFFERCAGGMIFKALGSYYCYQNGRPPSGSPRLALFSNVVTRDDLLRRLDCIRHAPCIFQEYVPKASELTVTVAGHRMFAAEILSQRSERSKHDWRRYDLVNTPYRHYELPTRLRELIATLMGRLGLVFGRLDLVLTPDGRAVFLEINPNGQWVWVQELTGLPITEGIGDLLISGDKHVA